MIITGYLLSSIMGFVLGTIGAGGSILILPILVYFIGVNPTLATSYSLVIVGLTALIGSLTYIKNKQINFSITFIFAIPSLITVYLTRRYFLPILPDNINLFDVFITKDLFIMVLFSVLMILAATFMIKSKDVKNNTIINNPSFLNNIILITEGIAVGFFTGIIGAGGGFLIIPALVLLTGLDMKAAIGSSLFIIFIKSFFGFVGDYQSGVTIDINILLGVLSFTSIGMIIGIILSKKTKPSILKQCFGWFILFAGFLIIIKEILL